MDQKLLNVVEMLKKRLGIETIESDWSGKYVSRYFKIPSPLIIPKGCRRIGVSVFWGWKKLEKVKIPRSVKEIGEQAFFCCTKLEKVTIPEGCEIVGRCAFWGCYNATIILRKHKSEFKYISPDAFGDCRYVKEEIRY